MIGVVFGLAMDYQVFLVTRMREEHVHGLESVRAVIKGFSHGAPVVTSAAIIMMGVFGGFILGSDALIKSIGFAFAIAVFFDAFVVRMTIMPAVLVLLRERAWWLPAGSIECCRMSMSRAPGWSIESPPAMRSWTVRSWRQPDRPYRELVIG